MIELRKAIQAKLKTIHPRVYFQVAPDDAEYPYIVFDFVGINDSGEYTEQGYVDVDGWDLPSDGDTTELETLMAAVNTGLNKEVLSAEGLRFILYLDRKTDLADDDPNIKRRKYIYQIKTYKGA